MRAERTKGLLRGLAATVAITTLVGCRIPGASFGTDPLQTRFAELTRAAFEAEPSEVPAENYTPPARLTSAEPIIIARGL